MYIIIIIIIIASLYRDYTLPNIKVNYLNTEWQEALQEAIRMGNRIQDELFDR